MTDHLHRICSVLVAATLVSTSAHAAPDTALQLAVGTGYRHSFTQDAGGFSLDVSVGARVGVFSVDVQSRLSNDHTFRKVDQRLAARNTTWLSLGAFIPGRRVQVGIVAGPGIGWVHHAGPAWENGGRFTSMGVHEELRLDLNATDDDFGLGVRLYLGAEHLWQSAVVPAPDHAILAGFSVWFGPRER